MVEKINLKLFPKFCVSRNWSEDKLHQVKDSNCCVEQRVEQQPLNRKIYHENVNSDQSTWTFFAVDFNSAVTDLKCPNLHGYRAALAVKPNKAHGGAKFQFSEEPALSCAILPSP